MHHLLPTYLLKVNKGQMLEGGDKISEMLQDNILFIHKVS